MMGRILRVTLPAILQRGAPNLAMTCLIRLVSSYGAPTLAAWVIVQRISNFALIPTMGLSRTLPAMVGQNLGAAQPDRAARSVSLTTRTIALIGGGILGLLALLAPQALALFSRDVETIRIGARAVRVLSAGYLGLALNYVFDAAQAGAGDTLSPMVINLISLWLIQVPLAYLLSRPVGLRANGIWLALAVGWIVQAMLMRWRFQQGKWKLKQI